MATLSPTTRRRLEIQGFDGIEERTLAETAPWLRLAFALCTVLAAVGTLLASPVFLWGLVPIAALAAAFPVHPFDLLYNHGLRHLTGTGPLPKRGAPNRFACGLGAAWLVVTAWASQARGDGDGICPGRAADARWPAGQHYRHLHPFAHLPKHFRFSTEMRGGQGLTRR